MILPRVKKEVLGAYHPLKDTVSVFCADAQGARILSALREMMPYLTFVSAKKCAGADVVLAIDKTLSETAEYYTMNISDGRCEVCAKDYRGLVNAAATLTKLIKGDGEVFSLPDATVVDYPDSSFRSFMADPARNKVPMDEMRALILSMAKSKLNVFHLHLTDSKGFAYASDIYPDLPPSPGGTYSKADLKELEIIRDELEHMQTLMPFAHEKPE